MIPGRGQTFAPSFGLVRAHLGLGLLGAVAFAAALLANAADLSGHFFQARLLGLTHLCVLGWLMPIALGALHQLVPVVLEVPVRSERLSWVALGLYVIGASGLVGHLWLLSTGWGLPLSAGILLLALLLHAGNLAATLAAAPRLGLTGAHLLAALGWLALAGGLGCALAVHLHSPYLPLDHLQALRAHAHAAGLGFFGLLILGVAYELLEMFLLSHGAPRAAGWAAFAAVNAAVASIAAGYLGGPHWLQSLGICLAGAGVVAFAIQVKQIVGRRVRRRLDVSWWLTAGSIGCLAAAVAAAAVLRLSPLDPGLRDRLVLAYGILALPGFVGSIVLGQLFKIVPFLVWLHRFSPLVGLKAVPGAAELLGPGPRRALGVLFHLGLGALVVGILADSPVLRVAGAAAFASSAALSLATFVRLDLRRP